MIEIGSATSRVCLKTQEWRVNVMCKRLVFPIIVCCMFALLLGTMAQASNVVRLDFRDLKVGTTDPDVIFPDGWVLRQFCVHGNATPEGGPDYASLADAGEKQGWKVIADGKDIVVEYKYTDPAAKAYSVLALYEKEKFEDFVLTYRIKIMQEGEPQFIGPVFRMTDDYYTFYRLMLYRLRLHRVSDDPAKHATSSIYWGGQGLGPPTPIVFWYTVEVKVQGDSITTRYRQEIGGNVLDWVDEYAMKDENPILGPGYIGIVLNNYAHLDYVQIEALD
jgi:hypothetical protein